MKKLLYLFAVVLIFNSCGSTGLTDDQQINSYLAPFDIPKGLDALYVFDEFSCSLCSENIFQDILSQTVDKNYIILYSSENHENFDYSQTPLVGYVNKETVTPISNGLIGYLRERTNTYMGNYKVTLSSTRIISIDKF